VSLREHDSQLHRCLQGSQPDAYVGLKRLFQRRCRIAKARLMPRPQRLLQLSVNPVSCQSAERGRRRLEAALDKLGTEALIPVLKQHSLASIERIDNLELLKPMAQLEVCVAELIEKRLAFRWFECDDSIRFSWICFQRSGSSLRTSSLRVNSRPSQRRAFVQFRVTVTAETASTRDVFSIERPADLARLDGAVVCRVRPGFSRAMQRCNSRCRSRSTTGAILSKASSLKELARSPSWLTGSRWDQRNLVDSSTCSDSTCSDASPPIHAENDPRFAAFPLHPVTGFHGDQDRPAR